jgi:hypothetical protein
LAFKYAIDAAGFLLRAKLVVEVGFTLVTESRAFPMLTGSISAPVYRTFWRETAIPFQEQFFAFTPA